MGYCVESAGCELHQPKLATSITSCCSHCCRKQRVLDNAETSPRDERSNPPATPDKPDCQGICGGAILISQAEFVVLQFQWFVIDRLIEVQSVGISPSNACLVQSNFVSLSDGNFGRFLCTLHASYRC
ncbi:hypothetical protein C5Y97_02645 [Blastopirellula marina]|uniref:Uncharacterized protein n=1 Tax=Blastopirellula marina TaxID=124 RepID=A0A2S8GCG6_9BACT|nr:hypothetical protein C5Y98_02645 [Blastopirellula marina]PTL46308.1 hypothetical protein C5Y97_02645 [Blastopirellula marina]